MLLMTDKKIGMSEYEWVEKLLELKLIRYFNFSTKNLWFLVFNIKIVLSHVDTSLNELLPALSYF
jgi:hypothetical protein